MPLPPDLPVVDHHCHLSPHGESVEAARRFRHAGGTHLFLATQRYDPKVPTTIDDYEAQFRTTIALARSLTEKADVVAYAVIAPYPIDLLDAAGRIGLPAATALQNDALELAGHLVEEREAIALGEVGRPHFPYPDEQADAVDTVFRRALEVARDVGCPAVVHSGDLDANGYRELAAFAAQNSFSPGKLVKHYARSIVPAADRCGIAPSFVARRETTRDALDEPGPWFLETDFLDDPSRPGAVLDLATVPRRAASLWESDPERRDRLRVPFVESIRTVYGFAPIAGQGRVP